MSEADFNKAQQRLKRAKKELQWLLNMLSNPATFLQKYDLDQSEKERLLNEDLAGILEILFPYADVLARQTGSQPTAGKAPSVGPLHPQTGRYRFIEIRRADGMVHMEMAGPAGPINWPQDPPWPEMAGPGGAIIWPQDPPWPKPKPKPKPNPDTDSE